MTKLSQGLIPVCAVFGLTMALNGCAQDPSTHHHRYAGHSRPSGHSAISKYSYQSSSEEEPLSDYGNEDNYVVEGKNYHVLHSAKNYNKVGVASWYGNQFHGQLTSTRERYNMYGYTAASPELPIPTRVRVTNLENGRSVVVKVNDRGPFKSDRLLDLSFAAAKQIGLINKGTAKVQVVALHTGEPQNLDSLAARRVLQVGAFAMHDNARRYSSRINQLTDLPVNIRAVTENNTTVFRVEVGPFETQASLNSTQKQLEKQGVKNITARFS